MAQAFQIIGLAQLHLIIYHCPMKIVPTAVVLIFTLLVIPISSYYFGEPLGNSAWILLQQLFWMCCASVVTCFVVGEITQNNSQVDKLWSLLPILYVWWIAAAGEFSLRLCMMAILVTIWGLRLSYNFALKGAYRWKFWEGEEDYRWKVLRQRPEFATQWKWTIFNLFFVCGYQNFLILSFCLPGVVALQHSSQPVGLLDVLLCCLLLFFIIIETMADWQQWKFQKEKHRLMENDLALPAEYAGGFIRSGLWSRSRHPNYFAEQSIWICFYGFSISSGGGWFNWSITGCILLMLLFQGSARFSEEISASKYPLYKLYQEQVPQFIPKWF